MSDLIGFEPPKIDWTPGPDFAQTQTLQTKVRVTFRWSSENQVQRSEMQISAPVDGRLWTGSIQHVEFDRRTTEKFRRILEAIRGTRETSVKLHVKLLLSPTPVTKQPPLRTIS